MKKLKYLMLIFPLFIFLASCGSSNGYYIFSNICELEKMELQFCEYGEVERYNDTSKDKNLKELQYDNFYAAYYKCEDFEFEIFAYEFINLESSQQYHKNVAVSTDRSVDLHKTTGMTKTKLVVIDETLAYSVFYDTVDMEEVENFLSQNLSKPIV